MFCQHSSFTIGTTAKQVNLIYEGFLHLSLILAYCGIYLNELKMQSQSHDDVILEKWFLMFFASWCFQVKEENIFITFLSSVIKTFVVFKSEKGKI